MTSIFYEKDADPTAIEGREVAVVGYGNQGRSWALNLRDSGADVVVCVRADSSREQAQEDGFSPEPLERANAADVICVLIPDDIVPTLPLAPKADALVVVASGYTLAFNRIDPPCDVGMVAPRMLGPEVRRCYVEKVGFITALSVHRDRSGKAMERVLAVAHAIGGLKQGAIELSPHQEAALDLATEQLLAPAMTAVHHAFVQVLMEQGIPLEAIVAELSLSGEFERTSRLVRLEGSAAQMAYHSPTSQYGQLSRADRFTHLDFLTTMQSLMDDITSGRFADEWESERDAGYPVLTALRAKAISPEILAMERELRLTLGEGVRQ